MSYCKVYSLRNIQKALEDEFEIAIKPELLEKILDSFKAERGTWRKRPVKWFNLEFESKRQCAEYLKISEHRLFHIMKDDRTFQGSKIEYI